MPDDLIAKEPLPQRDGSRLLVLPRHEAAGAPEHHVFRDLPQLLRPRSLVVLNDTRVIPARLHARKPTGGAVELLLVRPSDARTDLPGGLWEETWEVLARALGRAPVGVELVVPLPRGEGDASATVEALGDRGEARVRFRASLGAGVLDLAERAGQIPLPPYIEAARRRDVVAANVPRPEVVTEADRTRYQTVFARVPGAVAAPTAGLHFTPGLLDAVRAAGHETATVTLHVGPGTFRPVEVEDVDQHRMDVEHYDLPRETLEAVTRARAEGRPIVAVGTTVVRTLEGAARTGLRPGPGQTNLFLRPGAPFEVVTDLITNFHLPRSTLLMLVSAFAGRDRVLAAYEEAIAQRYRFYSYGDAMFIRGGTSS